MSQPEGESKTNTAESGDAAVGVVGRRRHRQQGRQGERGRKPQPCVATVQEARLPAEAAADAELVAGAVRMAELEAELLALKARTAAEGV